jgi:hypothetical protein
LVERRLSGREGDYLLPILDNQYLNVGKMEEISSIFNNAELNRAYEPKLYILIYCKRLKIAEWKQVEEKLHKC